MSTAQAPNYSPQIISGVFDVANYHVGKSLVNVFRDSFTPGGKIRTGDYFVSRSRPLIQQFYPTLPNVDQDAIHHEYQRAIGKREEMESVHGFRRFLMAREYEVIARYLFIIVETASRRAADQNLMAQISEAVVERSPQPPPVGTISTLSNPFSDSHETPPLADVDVGDLRLVEMSIMKSKTTGDTAVVLGLHGRDGTTQEVAGTFPPAIFSGDRRGDACSISSYGTVDHGPLGPPSEVGDDDDAGP